MTRGVWGSLPGQVSALLGGRGWRGFGERVWL
jgi:hypothetical protein